jgi:hypothetical protein
MCPSVPQIPRGEVCPRQKEALHGVVG